MLKGDKTLLIWPLLIVVIIAGWWAFMSQTIWKEKNTLNKRKSMLEGNVQPPITERQIQLQHTIVDSLKQVLVEIKKQNFSTEEFSSIGEALKRLGSRYQLRLIHLKPDYISVHKISTSEASVIEFPLEIGYKGTFIQFTKFIDGQSTFPFSIRIDDLELKKEENTSSNISFMIKGALVMKREINKQANFSQNNDINA